MAILQNSINANATSPLLPIQGGTGLSSPTVHGILVGAGSSAIVPKVLTNGQLLIGSTGSDPVGAVLTSSGGSITITNGAGSVNIDTATAAGGGFVWNDISATTFNFAAGNAYIADNASQVVGTLPATAVVGDTFRIAGGVTGTSGWKVAQNASQLIHIGNTVTTTGTGGSVTSGNQYDVFEFTCIVTNTTFIGHVLQGSNLSVA